MSFLVPKRTLGFKILSGEGDMYDFQTMAAGDYDLCAFNIGYDPDIAMYARKCARGDLSKDTSIAGKRSITVTFSVDLAYSGTVDTAPTYFKCLRACAMKETTYAGNGISMVTNAGYTAIPASIEIGELEEGYTPSQVVVQVRGAMGNAKFIVDSVGQPIRIDFEFKGVLHNIIPRVSGSVLTPTGFDTELPDAVLSATITMFGTDQTFDTTTIDLGNDVQLYSDPSEAAGIKGAHVVDRNPTMELDPDLEYSTADYTRWTGNTTGAMSMQVGTQMTLSAPAVQYTKVFAPGEREGHVVNNKTVELKRSSGNDEFKLLQGSES